MSEKSIIPFRFEMQEVRVVQRQGEPWFVLADVCRVMGIGNPDIDQFQLTHEQRMLRAAVRELADDRIAPRAAAIDEAAARSRTRVVVSYTRSVRSRARSRSPPTSSSATWMTPPQFTRKSGA